MPDRTFLFASSTSPADTFDAGKIKDIESRTGATIRASSFRASAIPYRILFPRIAAAPCSILSIDKARIQTGNLSLTTSLLSAMVTFLVRFSIAAS